MNPALENEVAIRRAALQRCTGRRVRSTPRPPPRDRAVHRIRMAIGLALVQLGLRLLPARHVTSEAAALRRYLPVAR